MSNKGISLISLIITIITIIIIATISIYNGYKTPEMADLTSFTSDMDMARVKLGTVRAQNFEEYGDKDYSFQEVYIQNAPEGFISISNDEIKGYLIHKDIYKGVLKKYGNGTISGDTVEFDMDDVFVYDKNGTVYYAKGYFNDGKLFYNATSYRELVKDI